MNEFKTFHPTVNFFYFALTISFSCTLMHPVFLLIGLVFSFSYLCILKGKAAMKSLFFIMPSAVAASLINVLFNHEGMTILCYLPSGNPITSESITYGLCASLMLMNVICNFMCFSHIITGEKLMYLFGRIAPSLSLVLSMTLRFVPLFVTHLKSSCDAQSCIGRGLNTRGILNKIKSVVTVISITVTWALENAVDTADSMRARGYGAAKRSFYTNYRFDTRDAITIAEIALLGAYITIGVLSEKLHFSFFPNVTNIDVDIYSVSIYICYSQLCLLPIVIEIKEAARWKSAISKM